MFFLSAALLFCFLATSQSAPVPCDDLLRPLDQVDVHYLLGRWVLTAGSLSSQTHKERFRQRDTANIVFANDTAGLSIHRHFGFGETCEQINSNVTVNGSIIGFDNFSNTFTILQSSCADCIVMYFDIATNGRQCLYLFSRGREVKPEELVEFTAQSECLGLFSPIMMDPTKKLCPHSEWIKGKIEPYGLNNWAIAKGWRARALIARKYWLIRTQCLFSKFYVVPFWCWNKIIWWKKKNNNCELNSYIIKRKV